MSTVPSDWAVPHASRLKYRQQFNILDKQMNGFLSGTKTLHGQGTDHTKHSIVWHAGVDVVTDFIIVHSHFCVLVHKAWHTGLSEVKARGGFIGGCVQTWGGSSAHRVRLVSAFLFCGLVGPVFLQKKAK